MCIFSFTHRPEGLATRRPSKRHEPPGPRSSRQSRGSPERPGPHSSLSPWAWSLSTQISPFWQPGARVRIGATTRDPPEIGPVSKGGLQGHEHGSEEDIRNGKRSEASKILAAEAVPQGRRRGVGCGCQDLKKVVEGESPRITAVTFRLGSRQPGADKELGQRPAPPPSDLAAPHPSLSPYPCLPQGPSTRQTQVETRAGESVSRVQNGPP